MEHLDLTSFNKAIHTFRLSIEEYKKEPNDFVRDSIIQRFEYTYELSWKSIKRYLELTSASPEELDGISFQNLIRTANEQGLLLNDWNKWKIYRNTRNITAHTYNEDNAIKVIAVALEFLVEAEVLYKNISEKLKFQQN